MNSLNVLMTSQKNIRFLTSHAKMNILLLHTYIVQIYIV